MKLFFNLFVRTISALLFGFSTLNSYGQYFQNPESHFLKLTVENGLSQNTINCILRDKSGFVWLGTQNGLNKFDGKKITILEKEFGKEKNFKDYRIFDILQDKQGLIWIASGKGIFKYDPDFEKIKRYLMTFDGLREPLIQSIEEEDESFLWLGTSDGLKLFEKGTGTIVESYVSYPFEPYSLSNNDVLSLCKVGNELWIGTAFGLSVLNLTNKTFKRYNHDISDEKSIGGDIVQKIVKGSGGKIWIGTVGSGLSVFDASKNSFKTFNTANSQIPNNDIRDIFVTKNGNLWLATNGEGLSYYNVMNNSFANYSHDSRNINGLSTNSFYSVYEDFEGILWLGSYSAGLNYNLSNINDFKSIMHLPGNTNSICENNARSIFLDSKMNLWVGTVGGLSKYDQKDKLFTSFISGAKNSMSLSSNKVICILEDKQKNLWVGTYSGGINLLKAKSSEFIHFKQNQANNSTISSDNVYCITEDHNGRIWAASSGGLDLYNPVENNWSQIGHLDVRDICLTADQKMYLATTGGICEFDPFKKSFKNHIYNENSHVPTTVLFNDNDEKIWFGTQGEGFGFFDKKSQSFRLFSTSDGLPSNSICGIIKYTDKYLWLSTYKGISLFDKQTLTFKNYGMIDGIPFLGFHPRSSVVLPDSILAFGGTNGIVYFDPRKVVREKSTSKILFNSLEINGKHIEIGSKNSPLRTNLNLTDVLKLRYNQRDYSIGFVDINFNNRGLGQYAFKLDNYMSDWRSIESQSSVAFANMPQGDYVLRIKSLSGQVSQDNQTEAKLNILIISPFWMRWYFFVFLFFVFIGILYLYSKYTLISINKKNDIRIKNLDYEKHEEFNRLRLQFFTYISHELRTPLTLISDPLRKLIHQNKGNENSKYLELIKRNSGRLIRLVDQILDFRKLENDTLNLLVSEKYISSIVSDICCDFDHVAKTEQVKYTIENNVAHDLLGWVDSDKIEKILYNLLNNAFKFTKVSGEVKVRLTALDNNEKIEIVVSDTGYGIHPEKLNHIFDLFYSDEKLALHYRGGVGVGLTYVKRLVDLHHGTISVTSTIEKGTAFSIVLPIRKEDYISNEIWLLADEKELTVTDNDNSIDWSIADEQIAVHGKDVPLVLIVEDETDLRNYLVGRLSHKFRVTHAVDGLDALTKLENIVPDLILSDNVMPGMDGITLCNEVKSRKEWCHIPFVFLSAWNSDDYKLRGLTVGAEDYICKPFQFEILEAKIESIIINRRRLSEIALKMIKVEPREVKIETRDEIFILRTQEIIEKNIDNDAFTTKTFEDELYMSHSVIYRKLKKLTGLSANEYIREYRLRRAAQILLQDENLTIIEVCYVVGFTDSKYFSHCFKKLFKVSPSEYAQSQNR